MGQEEGKQKELISEHYRIVKTIAPGEYWVKRKNKNQELMLRILSFYIQEEMEAYIRILEKRKKIKNPHLLELIEHTRISEQNMCSSMFKIRTVVQYPFKTLKDQITQRSLGNNKSYFNEDQLWSILYSCCHALYSLYVNKFHHQCINTKQIFIDTSGLVKMADSVLVSSIKNYLSLMNQGEPELQPRYISPELVNLVEDNNFYFYEKEKSDVFILAMIMLEIGNLQTVNYYNSTTKKFDFDAYLPAISQLRNRYSQQLCSLLEQMLVMDFKERPRLQSIINSIEQKTIYTGSSGNTSFNTFSQESIIKEGTGRPFPNQFTEQKDNYRQQPSSAITHFRNTSAEQLTKPIDSGTMNKNITQIVFAQPVPVPQNVKPLPIPISQNRSSSQNTTIHFPSLPQPPKAPQRSRNDFQLEKWSFQAIMRDIEQSSKTQKKPENTYTPYQQLVGLTTDKESTEKVNQRLAKRQPSHPVQKPNITVRFSTGTTTGQQQPSSKHEDHSIFSHLPHFQSSQLDGRRFSQTKFGGIQLQNKIEEQQNKNYAFHKEKYNIQQTKDSNQVNPHKFIPVQQKSLSNVARKVADSSPQLPLETISQFVTEESPHGKYEGFVLKGKRNGVGKMIYPDGGYYQGKWSNGQMCGYGQLFYQNGNIAYKGFWERDMFNGEGTVYNDNPDESQKDEPINYLDLTTAQNKCVSYQGIFLDDQKHGMGTLTFITGETFIGMFAHDIAEGEGEFHQLSGDVVTGLWKENKFVGTK